MKKKYKAIFFDWDGTAVINRSAPVDEVVKPMKKLLSKGVKLVIVSGTTYDKIADGKLHTHFSIEELKNLYLGLGRGAYNYHFHNGNPTIFKSMVPEKSKLLQIHDICYAIHRELLEKFNLSTDVVFSRPNYCKIDLVVDNQRGTQLFMQGDEVEHLKTLLREHGIVGGLEQLISLSESMGEQYGIHLSATCDAKYLEVGTSCKSDNVDVMLHEFAKENICEAECSFWGDEFVGFDEKLFGSDSFMRTLLSQSADFYDVSTIEGIRPDNVIVLGGGIQTFIDFLWEQVSI